MVRAAPSRDYEPPRAHLAIPRAEGIDRRPALFDQPRCDLRLLEDLVAEAAHLWNLILPPTMVSRTRSSPSSTTRSAQLPTRIRPRPRSPRTRAGTADAMAIARVAFIPGIPAILRTMSSIVAALPASVPSSSRTTVPSL